MMETKKNTLQIGYFDECVSFLPIEANFDRTLLKLFEKKTTTEEESRSRVYQQVCINYRTTAKDWLS